MGSLLLSTHNHVMKTKDLYSLYSALFLLNINFLLLLLVCFAMRYEKWKTDRIKPKTARKRDDEKTRKSRLLAIRAGFSGD